MSATSDTFPPAVQRPALVRFLNAITASESALRRDECGDWRIEGSTGHVYAVPTAREDSPHSKRHERRCAAGFSLYVMVASARRWTNAKRALSVFAKITNDGDEEGALLMDRLPATKDEAEAIRSCLGVRKRRTVSEETRARLREMSLAHGFTAGVAPSSSPRSPRDSAGVASTTAA